MADDVEFSSQQKIMAAVSVILIAACVAYWTMVPQGKQRPVFDDKGPTHVESSAPKGQTFSTVTKPPDKTQKKS